MDHCLSSWDEPYTYPDRPCAKTKAQLSDLHLEDLTGLMQSWSMPWLGTLKFDHHPVMAFPVWSGKQTVWSRRSGTRKGKHKNNLSLMPWNPVLLGGKKGSMVFDWKERKDVCDPYPQQSVTCSTSQDLWFVRMERRLRAEPLSRRLMKQKMERN